jgi:ABC-2 type transport system ATP-binding protein
LTDEAPEVTEQTKNPHFFLWICYTAANHTKNGRRMRMYAIETSALVKRYKNLTAVDGLTLQVKQGELFALLGVNGAGKTTAIKMLSCLSRPTAGDAQVGGYSIIGAPERVKALIGVSPQETAVAPNLSVKENLALICGIHGFSGEETGEKIRSLSDQFGLEAVLERRAGKLSGGWQRRVSIAMALIGQPQILFLDEPTLGLDVLARHELWKIIRALKGEVTIILTTHYMEEAAALSDRIGIMKNGRLLAVGTVDALKEKAGVDDFEAAFVSIVQEGDV